LEIAGRFVNGHDGTLAFELGGTAAGSQYDQVVIDGSLTLEGTLAVSLVDLGSGLFTPSIGNSFTLITASDGRSGTFDTLQLPDGYVWNVTYGANDVVLSVVGVGLAGDFNGDGAVDAADYVVWRKNGGSQADFLLWRNNFGATSGTGVGSGALGGVPEPASWLLTLLAACGLALRRRPLIRSVRCVAWPTRE
jgi:hypothetical protein